ncbi:hypothetical protein [Paenibacillus luteus]|uniref:hypothetical protein n=1 Tax=Paenibacillus luteus TaxID=2545753 RepID=UPI00114369F5|nr:hypothetical protein [Paenibacillus luteus]
MVNRNLQQIAADLQENQQLQLAQHEVQEAHFHLQEENQELLEAEQLLQLEIHHVLQAQEQVKKEHQDIQQAQQKLQEAKTAANALQNKPLQ